MTDISNLKINERSNGERPSYELTSHWNRKWKLRKLIEIANFFSQILVLQIKKIYKFVNFLISTITKISNKKNSLKFPIRKDTKFAIRKITKICN